jgi:flavin-dependent dehydrogenase
MTQRLKLDAFLLDQARTAGAVVMERTGLKRIQPAADLRDPVVLGAGPGEFEARVVIGADGANGTTARLTGIATDVIQAVALEANLRPAGGVPPGWSEAGGVYSIGCPGGYGWIFPKGDHLNIGVAGWEYAAPTLRRRLHEFTRACGFAPDSLEGMRGHRIPFRRRGSPLAKGRTVLAGDAAGLADPMTGDGIYGAVVSGKAAAAAASEFISGRARDLSGYERAIEAGVGASDRVAMQVHDLVHLGMDQFFWSVARVPLLWRACCAIARGDYTYKSAKERLGPYGTLIDLAADLVRVVPLLQRRIGRVDPVPPERFWRTRVGRSARRSGAA